MSTWDIDAMSMAVSLGVRPPFTDHLFIEEVRQLPGYFRCAGAPDKPFEWRLLRSLSGRWLPVPKKTRVPLPV